MDVGYTALVTPLPGATAATIFPSHRSSYVIALQARNDTPHVYKGNIIIVATVDSYHDEDPNTHTHTHTHVTE
jgi:hypothetical protein